jgi:NADPH-dependent 2,4-dienoyl-CoA reductase/sulfur reductase-like enzyme
VSAPYLILGNGAAALAALRAIRRHDTATPAVVVTAEAAAAYSPALLPYLIAGRVDEGRLALTGEAFYQAHGAALLSGRRAVELNADEHFVLLDDGSTVAYGRLLVATGASAKSSPVPGAGDGEPLTLRTLDDARRISRRSEACRSVCVLGAGLAGLEMAMALRGRGKQVTVVAASRQVLSRNAGPDEAGVVQGLLERAGIRVLLGRTVEGLERARAGRRLLTAEGDRVPADLLLAGKGARPNLGFVPAESRPAGALAVDGRLRTTLPDVWAAGDVALARDTLSGERRGFATWPSACLEGAAAGSGMAGADAMVAGEVALNIVPVFGTSAAFIGATAGAPSEAQAVVWRGSRPGQGLYRRLLLHDDRVVGAALVGACRDAGLLRHLVETGARLRGRSLADAVAGVGWGAVKGRSLPRL